MAAFVSIVEGAEEGANDLVVMMVTMMTKITTWPMMIHMAMCTVGVTMCKYNAQFVELPFLYPPPCRYR